MQLWKQPIISDITLNEENEHIIILLLWISVAGKPKRRTNIGDPK